MKVAIVVAICLLSSGSAAISGEAAQGWMSIFFRGGAEGATSLHESCRAELDDLVPRIKRDIEIACGADPVAAEVARERIKVDRRRALKLNSVLRMVMRAFPRLPKPRYYTEPRPRRPITDQEIQALA